MGGGWDYNRVWHLEPCGFGSLIRLRSQTAPGLQFSRYRRLAGYFNHTPMYQATALRSESRKNTRPHSVRDCRRYSRLICGSTRVRISPRRVAKKGTISDQGTYSGETQQKGSLSRPSPKSFWEGGLCKNGTPNSIRSEKKISTEK